MSTQQERAGLTGTALESRRDPSAVVSGLRARMSAENLEWAMFFLGEYANMVNVSAILVTVFFGGWMSPIPVHLFPDGSIPSALGSIF